MAKRIVFSKKSFTDIDRITEFNDLRNKSEIYSRKFLIRLEKRLKLLQKQPFNGLATNDTDTLLLVWDQYYIFYTIDEFVMEINSIYHQKENIQR